MRADKLLRALLLLVPSAACVLLYLPTLSGGFLSDDYAVLGALDAWHRGGRLGGALLSKFVSGLDAPSNYYRPLPMLSFGVNFVLAGAAPYTWRLTNLLFHISSGALLFTIAHRLIDERGGVTRTPWAPAVAATVFLLFPTSAEAVAWVSGRYDLLALFFSLLSIACFQRMARWSDRWGWASLAAAACAFASKESAVLLPVFVTALAIARRSARPRGVPDGLIEASPWLALAFVYFAARAAVFGSPFRVYAGTSPLDTVLNGDALRALSSVPAWLDAALTPTVARIAFLTASAALIVVGAMSSLIRRVVSEWLAVATTMLLSVALLLPHVSALAPTGEQGRLFYVSSALSSLLIAYAASPVPRSWPGFRTTTAVAVALLLGAEVVLLRGNITQWAHAGRQVRMLALELPRLALEIPPDGYGFVLAPDHLGSVPFARNAQGGLVLPPSQPVPLSMRLIVQTPADLPEWPDHIRRGLVDALRLFPLEQVWTVLASGKAVISVKPSNYYCWDATSGKVETIALPPVLDDRQWLDAWKGALARGPCSALSAELPAR
jgi:hypothetical protein